MATNNPGEAEGVGGGGAEGGERRHPTLLAQRPDDGGGLGNSRKVEVNLFSVKPAVEDVYVFSLVIEQTPWKEFQAGVDTVDYTPSPLQPSDRHKILYQLRRRGEAGEEGMISFGVPTECIAYDGNAILVTSQPIPELQRLMADWSPDTGRAVPAVHFGTVPEGAAESLDEDARGRELTLRRFAAQLNHDRRPHRYRATLTPICDPVCLASGIPSNKFSITAVFSSWGQYKLTSTKVIQTIFSQWCMNLESPQWEMWYMRKPSVALAYPYAPGRDASFKIPLGSGMEVWYGLYFNTRLGRGTRQPQFTINLDRSSGAMYAEETLMQYLAEVLGGLPRNVPYPHSFTASQASLLNRNCRGLKVTSRHISRSYTIKAFHNDRTPRNTRFACEEYGGEVSVEEYFEKKFKYKLKFPNMGMVEAKPPRRLENKAMFLPVEVLDVVMKKQEVKNLPEWASSIMITKLCKPAQGRKAQILKLGQMARFGADAWSQSFGMVVTPKMMTIQSRILPAPSIRLGSPRTPRIKDGVWDFTGKDRLVDPRSLDNKSVVIFSFQHISRKRNINLLAQEAWNTLRSKASSLGMNFAQDIYSFVPSLSGHYATMVEQICGAVTEARQESCPIKLMIFIMKERNNKFYSKIKYIGDHHLGIPSQCLLLKTISPLRADSAKNVLLKINVKLGGTNWTDNWDKAPGRILDLLTRPTLILGATFDSACSATSQPSIVSVVGNTDLNLGKWMATVALSRPGVELDVPHFRYAVEQRIFQFVKKNKVIPHHIILFRDGVSEGEYEAVMAGEVDEIRASIRSMFADSAYAYVPKLTFIACMKRHHIRFFPVSKAENVGNSGNVAPGTVVDTEINSPQRFDFWLMSHLGLQGTCRPTYYQVLLDENGLSSDQVELMTYWLCHLYARCPRSVSWPTPTYYAHLALVRTQDHLKAHEEAKEDDAVVAAFGNLSLAPPVTFSRHWSGRRTI